MRNRSGVAAVALVAAMTMIVLTGAVVSAGLVSAKAVPGQEASQLGSVAFASSCNATAQSSVVTGVALLHSFQYTESEAAFSKAAGQDSKCAMANWGEAMALYHQLWDFPNAATLAKGRADIEKAQALGAPTERERGYIAAAAAFFEATGEPSHAARRTAYSEALAKLYKAEPDDVNAGAFYALSLISLAEDEVDAAANRKKAIAVLDPLFENNPNHPGVAHYLIHAADTPELAAQGLAAARRYAQIAPDSSHALHMPSHIFVRRGLWQDAIASNIAAQASAHREVAAGKAEIHYETHTLDFLNYSYLQSGNEARAREAVAAIAGVPHISEHDLKMHQAPLAARTALELHRWSEAAALPAKGVPEMSADAVYFARAIGKARLGDASGASAELAEMQRAVAQREKRAHGEGYVVRAGEATDLAEAKAWLTFAQGHADEAIEQMRAAAVREETNGVNSLTMPAREMLGDMLLESHHAEQALAEYRTALKNSPNRFDAIYGAGKAAEAAGDKESAREYFAQLQENCGAAGDRPELAEAKALMAEK
jgi:hypothetical protein